MNRFGMRYRVMAWVMVMLMCYTPVVTFAQSLGVPPKPADTSRQANEGQGFGEAIAPSDIGSFDNGTVTFPGGAGISLNELFPDARSQEGVSSNFPHSQPESSLTAEASSDQGLNAIGGSSLLGMRAEVTRPGGPSSIQGMAYEVIHKAGEQSRPDFSNDPMLNASRDTYDNIDLITEGFADCSVDEQIQASSFQAHVPDYNQCTRVIDNTNTCRVNNRQLDVVRESKDILTFRGNVDHTIRLTVRVATPTPVSYSGSGGRNTLRNGVAAVGGLYQESNETNHGDLSANITYNTVSSSLMEGNVERKLADTEMHLNWHGSVQTVQMVQRPTPSNNYTLIIDIYTPAPGEQHVNLTFNMTLIYIGEEDREPCGAINDGFCESGPFICTDSAERTINGVRISSARFRDAVEPIAPGYSGPICYAGYRETDCEFYKGDMDCWIDPQGEEQCHSNDGGELDTCRQYEENPSCGFVSTSCVSGAESSGGVCYVFDETWDCGESYDIPTLEKVGQYSCSGPIRCMGSECFDFEPEQSPDFARATALMNAANNMASDMTCGGGTSGESCMVFQGDPGECKQAVGGVVDCCEKPSGVSLKDYLTLIMTVPKIDSAITSLDDDGALSAMKGAYQLLRDPAVDSWSTVTQPFTSRLESVSGTFDSLRGTVQDAIVDAVQPLKEKVTEMTGRALGNAAAEAGAGGVGEVVGGEAAESFSEQLLGAQGAGFLNMAMTAYQIYVVTMLVIQVVWACEAEEFEMNAKRQLKSAHYVGSYCKTKVLGACIEKREVYCTFNSPLSRIMQQEVRKQLNMSWGSPENPSCGGIPIASLELVNWDNVNLDEWLGILQSNGLYKGAMDFDLESITGAGSHLDIDGKRNNAIDRTLGRFEDTDLDEFRANTRDELRIENRP